MNTGDLSRMRHLDAIEAAAYRDMFANAPRALAVALGIETREVAGATLLMVSVTSLPRPTTHWMRSVMLTGTRAPVNGGYT